MMGLLLFYREKDKTTSLLFWIIKYFLYLCLQSYADSSISNGEEREGGTRHMKKAFTTLWF